MDFSDVIMNFVEKSEYVIFINLSLDSTVQEVIRIFNKERRDTRSFASYTYRIVYRFKLRFKNSAELVFLILMIELSYHSSDQM